jgi:hypothetical protein
MPLPPPLPGQAPGQDIPRDEARLLHIAFILSLVEYVPVERHSCTTGRTDLRFLARSPMTRRGKLVALLAVLGFAVFLLWSTLTSQHAECTVAVAFGGARGSGTASAASEADALREAQTAACGPLARGMDDRIACSRTPPITRHCRTL